RRLRQSRRPAGQGREPVHGDRRQWPGAERRTGRERHRPAGAGLAGRFQRLRGRGTGVDDRNPARLRNQCQGDLDHRFDARLPEQQAVSTPMKAILACALVLVLGGCAATLGDARPFAAAPGPARGYAVAPPVAAPVQAPAAGGGSIYAAAGGDNRGMSLFQDNKARGVGDLLTIVLVENTRAKTNARTSVSKESGVDIAAPTIFGQDITYNGRPLLQAGIEGSRDFAGAGDSAQSNQLAGNITV